jgi:amidase
MEGGRARGDGGAMTLASPSVRLTRDQIGYYYDPGATPVATIEPGATVAFETHDARAGALFDRPVGSLFELPKPDPLRGNPLTGPLAVRGAKPGDALVIDILAIDTVGPGWAGGHAHVNPLAPGRVPRPLGRICEVRDGVVHFSDTISFPARPMIGCIGTAPADGPIHAGIPGRHGGNIDQSVVTAGTRIHLPVEVPDALLFVGDVHAVQGDGELSGVGLEIAAEVILRVDVRSGARSAWPWLETTERLAVLTAADDFPTARREAVEAMVALLERRLGMEPAEALALLSVAGDIRIGQAFGGPLPMTVRLELPRIQGLELE